jgi:hypothetical protein
MSTSFQGSPLYAPTMLEKKPWLGAGHVSPTIWMARIWSVEERVCRPSKIGTFCVTILKGICILWQEIIKVTVLKCMRLAKIFKGV